MKAQAKRTHAQKPREVARVFDNAEELGREMSRQMMEALMKSIQLSFTTDLNKSQTARNRFRAVFTYS
jgi:hypothetical protein